MLSNFHTEPIGVKAQLQEELGGIVTSTKFSLDPEITSFEMLRSILTKAFNIKGDFMISYLAVDDEEHIVQLSLLNDWDLDAAILNCASQNCLKLVVQQKGADDGLGEWDIIDRADIPSIKSSDLTSSREKFVNVLTDKLSNILGSGKKSKSEASYKSAKSAMTDPEFRNYMDSNGKMVKERDFRESIYKGGIESSLRKVTWRHLLNVFPPELNGKERYAYLQHKSKEYMLLREAWKSEFKTSLLSDELKFITSMVKKDVIRTDRTHPYFKGREDNKNIESLFDLLCTYSTNHPDVSYCQGMSDIASVLLVVQNDEANAYLCFCAIMKRLKYNFMFDGKAMTCKFDHLKLLLSYYDPEFWTHMIENEVNDLFFTYRWLLLELKREFAFDDALYMLEVMWSTLPVDTSSKGVSLSNVYRASSDGTRLIPIRKVPSGAESALSASSGTPTPYTKLMSLCRKPSGHMNHSTQDTEKHSGIKKSEVTLASSASGVGDLDSGMSPDSQTSAHDNELEKTICEGFSASEPKSTFYLAVNQDDNGQLKYTDECDDDCSEALESCALSESNENVSCSSADSGITTHPQTPLAIQASPSASELQFAFETSGNFKTPCQQKSIFPPPEEFGFGNPFLMFAAYTMILQHRDHIMQNKLDFDSIVMLFDRKVRKNDVHKILHRTKVVYEQYMQLERQTYDC